ncbi:MAG TPA: D-alanine--D-alanine ligase [Planctomycetota bacterium]|nr:D-alanine--D-alanine ligase [Planctomycetota bacterium]
MSGGKVRIAVLMGGPSGEREVSLRSGAAVLGALDRARFAPIAVDVRRNGSWVVSGPTLLDGGAGPAIEMDGGTGLSAERVPETLRRATREGSVDVVFLALHGRFGEDGTVQGILEAAGVPYTGSAVLASALAMDKERAKAVVAAAGLRVPPGEVVDAARWRRDPESVLDALLRSPGIPCFVKPRDGGSSLGAGPAGGREPLRARIEDVLDHHADAALVEERIEGVEVSCAVLGNRGRPLRALPVVEIVPRGREFFDYKAKYEPGACEEICPARLSEEERRRVEEAAIEAHRAIGCDGMSRSDFILQGGVPWYLETNTLPGLTGNSLGPRAARAAGLEFPALVDLLVEMALERHAGARRKPGERAA